MEDKVNILGVDYSISIKKYDDDPIFKDNDVNGYCEGLTRSIVICDMTSYPDYDNSNNKEIVELQQKLTLRHEIVHAFLEESGLSSSALTLDSSWARNEEMVDWIAIQGPKIYKAWQESGAI